jgi:hypothetical protein
MSFTNPDIFKRVQEKVGQEVEITITKNDAGYNQWATLDDVGAGPTEYAPATGVGQANSSSLAAPAATRVTGSNYETPAERAIKQVYIVKQSSIANAVNLATANKEKATKEDIVAAAQFFVDFVFANETKEPTPTA